MTAHRPLTRYGLALSALLAASAGCAGETVVALSPEARTEILDAAANRPSAGVGDIPINGLDRRVHGEVGMMIGTNGARGVSGSMAAPLGESGSVAIAFENTRFGRTR